MDFKAFDNPVWQQNAKEKSLALDQLYADAQSWVPPAELEDFNTAIVLAYSHYSEVGRLVIKGIDLYNQGLETEALVAIASVGDEMERGNANIRFANELAR